MFYDVYGNPLSVAYDFYGNPIGGTQVNAHMVLEMLSHTNSASDAWKSKCDEAYSLLKADYLAHDGSIPFYISTDQHGSGLNPCRYVNNIDDIELANISLGDYCQNTYFLDTMQALRTDVKWIANTINVIGNHDKKVTTGSDVDVSVLRRSFLYDSTRFNATELQDDTFIDYVLVDEEKRVKWIVIDPYTPATVGSTGVVKISTNAMSWLIDEIKKDDYDSVILIHQPIEKTGFMARGREEPSDGQTDATICFMSISDMLRNANKRNSGTIVDDDGLEHQYDFSGIITNVLCVLNGHWHFEMYKESDGLTHYCADWQNNNSVGTFGLIDRNNAKLRIYKFDTSTVYDVLELSI